MNLNRWFSGWSATLAVFACVFMNFPYSQNAYAVDMAAAQEEGLEFLLFENVPMVYAASKKAQKASEAPAMVMVITRQDIRTRGYSNLYDIFRDLPGMDSVENYFTEWGTNVPIRGVDGNNKIVVLLNGVRVNPPGGENMPFKSDFNIRHAEQIEVIYGPGSTLYGQDAISAVINIRTLQPSDTNNGDVGVTFGTDSHTEAWASYYHDFQAADGSVIKLSTYAQWFESDLTDLEEDYPDYWSNYLPVARAFGRGDTSNRWDKGRNIFFQLEKDNSSIQGWYRWSSRSSSEAYIPGILFYVDEAEWTDSQLVLEAKNKQEFSDTFQLESSLSYNRYEVDPDTRYVFPSSATELFFDDYKYALGTGTTLEEQFTWTPNEKLSFIGGLTFSYYDVIPKATIPGGADRDIDITSQGGFFEYVQDGVGKTEARVNNLVYSNIGAYLEANIKLAESLHGVLGARVDKNSRFDKVPFSPRASLIYQASDKLTLKYIFTKAFVQPAPYFAYNVFDSSLALNISNPDLDPEEGDSHEFNVTFAQEGLLLGGSAYKNTQSNLIIPGDLRLPGINLLGTVTVPSGSRLLTHSGNAGDSESTGFDFYSRFAFGQFSTWASYSYVDFERTVAGVTTGLGKISDSQARLGVTWAPMSSLSITPSMVWRSDMEDDSGASSVGLGSEVGSNAIFNVHVVYSPTQNLEIFADFKNLTDEQYAMASLGSYQPQQTFRAFAGARWRM